MSVCLSVWLYPTNAKTAEPIGLNFFVGPQIVPGMVILIFQIFKDAQNYKKLSSKILDFRKILKIYEKKIAYPQKFSLMFLYRGENAERLRLISEKLK